MSVQHVRSFSVRVCCPLLSTIPPAMGVWTLENPYLKLSQAGILWGASSRDWGAAGSQQTSSARRIAAFLPFCIPWSCVWGLIAQPDTHCAAHCTPPTTLPPPHSAPHTHPSLGSSCWHEDLQKLPVEKSFAERRFCLAAWGINTWLQALIEPWAVLAHEVVYLGPLRFKIFYNKGKGK